MSKTNNKLILISGILAFILGLLLASPAYAKVTGVMNSGYVTFPPNLTQSTPNINPTVNLIVDNPNINYDSSTYIRWTSTNATVCNASGGSNSWPGNKNTSGNFYTGALINSTTYNIICSNNSGSASSSVTVSVSSQIVNQTSSNTTTNTTNTTVSETTDTNETVTTSENDNSFSGLTANALEGSNSFLPTGLLQWIFLAIIIVAIIFLWRYVHAEDKYLSEPLKHA